MNSKYNIRTYYVKVIFTFTMELYLKEVIRTSYMLSKYYF